MEKLSIEELESLESTCAPTPQCLVPTQVCVGGGAVCVDLTPPPYYCMLLC